MGRVQKTLARYRLCCQTKAIFNQRHHWCVNLSTNHAVLQNNGGIDYLVNVKSFSILTAATVTSSMFTGWAVGAPLMGLCTEKIKRRRLLLIIGALCASVLISIALYTPNLTVSDLRWLFFLVGVASSSQILSFSIAHDIIKPQLTGTAVCFNQYACKHWWTYSANCRFYACMANTKSVYPNHTLNPLPCIKL